MSNNNNETLDAPAGSSGENLHYVARVDEIDEGERVIVEVEGREIAVFNSNNEYHALLNYCVHQGGPVCEGVVGGSLTQEGEDLIFEKGMGTVACPWHGWQFDIKTGYHTAQSNYKLPTYEPIIRDGNVYLQI